MKLIKIECPSCQQHLEIEAPDRGLPKLPTIIISIASIIIAFSLGSIHSAAPHNPQAAKNNIAAAPIAAATELSNNPVPVQRPTPPVAVVVPVVTNAPAPVALTAFGWTIGSKLPRQCDLQDGSRYDLVFQDLGNQRKAPFENVTVHCLSDRTIYQIDGYTSFNGNFADILATLEKKYGVAKPGDIMDHTVFYKWEMGDAVLSISSSAEGTLISYGAGSLDARHEQEVKTKQEAAGAGFASHL